MLNSYYGAILTLYDNNCQIDEAAQSRYIRFLMEKGIKGFFPCGTSGEYTNLSQRENLRLLELVMQENQGDKPMIPCAGTTSCYNTVELINKMTEMGVRDVSVCPPYYTPLRQCDILDYYQYLLAHTKANIYLYNIPAFTNPIGFETFEKLLSNPRIPGIKDSSGNMKTISRYIAAADDADREFRVMTGTDEMILPALCGGCYGSVSALSAIIPEVHNLLYDCYRTDLSFAQALQIKIAKLAAECEQFVFPVGYKFALEARGFAMPAFRQNIAERADEVLFREKRERIHQMVAELLQMTEERKAVIA